MGSWSGVLLTPGGGRRTALRPALAIGCVLLSACSGWLRGGTQQGTVPEVVDPLRPVTAMLAEYGGLMELVERRADALLGQCMRERGFEYVPPDRGEWQGWSTPASYFNPLSVERAEAWGYVLEDADPSLVEAPPLSESEQEAFGVALMGTDEERVRLDNGLEIGTGGCLGEARAAVAGSIDESVEWLAFSGHLQILRNQVWEEVLASPEWQETEKAWTRCMRDAGYDVDSPADATDLALAGPGRLPFERPKEVDPEALNEERPTEWEIQVAVTDATCRTDTSFEDEWDRLMSYFEQEAVADNPELVLIWHETSEKMRQVVDDELSVAPNPEEDPQDGYAVPTTAP